MTNEAIKDIRIADLVRENESYRERVTSLEGLFTYFVIILKEDKQAKMKACVCFSPNYLLPRHAPL